MQEKSLSELDESVVPSLDAFEGWKPERVWPLVRDKTIVFSPGGSSRWYFLERKREGGGYDRKDEFLEYGRHAFQRAVELAGMMFADGIRSILLVAMTPKQSNRNEAYNQHLGEGFGLLVDEEALALYDKYQMGVLFRGTWQRAFQRLGAQHLLERCSEIEAQTASTRERWLIWVTEDDPIPASLLPLVRESLERNDELPSRAALCQAYYGRPLLHADMFIGNNKPSIEGQLPPLMTVGDLYFTVAPTYYMDQRQWRHILFDHLFARHGHYRDYTQIDPQTLEQLGAFYQANYGVTLGVGTRDEPSQTWRPSLPSSLNRA